MTISTHGALSRLHKFAGVIIAPFLIVAALSGFLYALAPTFEPWIYHDEVTATAQGSPRSLDEQIATAQRQHPDGTVVRVEPSEDCLLYTSPSPRDATLSRMPSSA